MSAETLLARDLESKWMGLSVPAAVAGAYTRADPGIGI
jgi:hypothetical protein